jgi:hypothetical protein
MERLTMLVKFDTLEAVSMVEVEFANIRKLGPRDGAAGVKGMIEQASCLLYRRYGFRCYGVRAILALRLALRHRGFSCYTGPLLVPGGNECGSLTLKYVFVGRTQQPVFVKSVVANFLPIP